MFDFVGAARQSNPISITHPRPTRKKTPEALPENSSTYPKVLDKFLTTPVSNCGNL
jgi:hypothetical protein